MRPLKVVFYFHFRFCLLVWRGCSGWGGGVWARRHIIRRAVIGGGVSPDTAVIVLCGGSSAPVELCAEEWSRTVSCAATAYDMKKTRWVELSLLGTRWTKVGPGRFGEWRGGKVSFRSRHQGIKVRVAGLFPRCVKPTQLLRINACYFNTTQSQSAKCPAWRIAAGAAPVRQRSKRSIPPEPTG